MTTNRPFTAKHWGLLLAVLLGVAACVTLKWQHVYQGKHYSHASDVYVGASGKVYMSGRLDPNELFIATYDKNGSMLWDQQYTIKDHDFLVWGTESMVEDPDGDLFVVKAVSPQQRALIVKFDSNGGLVQEWETQYDYYEVNIKRGPDGNLYVSDPGGRHLEVFDRVGNALWSFTTNAPLKIQKSSSAMTFLNDNTVLLSGNTLRVFDKLGNLVDIVSASDLLFDRFYSVSVRGTQLMLITQAVQKVEWITLNEQLQVSSKVLIHDGEADHVLLSTQGDTACVSLMDKHPAAGDKWHARVGNLNLDGTLAWVASIHSPAEQYNYPMLKAVQADCYFGIAEAASRDNTTSFIQQYRANGSLGDKVITEHNVLEDFAIQGNSIYQVGITGSYDGTVIEATITKHQRN